MFLSHHQQLIFIHIHRTGGTTLVNLLKEELGNKLKCYSQHGNAKGEEVQLLQKHRDYKIVTFVRNPWDRLLSWYALFNKWSPENLEKEQQKFEFFLENDQAIVLEDGDFHYNQLEYIRSPYKALEEIIIYRFEDFEASVKALFTELNLPLYEIPTLNSTTPKIYQEFYTEKSKKLVAVKCAEDISYFGYSF